jgi:hypothetical protein
VITATLLIKKSADSARFSPFVLALLLIHQSPRSYTRIPIYPGTIMANGTHSLEFKIGGLAFLAGVLATLVTAYAVVSRKHVSMTSTRPEYGGYDGELGI